MEQRETLRRYQWRYRNVAMQGAQNHGIGVNVVEQALTQLGVSPGDFPLGTGVLIATHYDLGNLPARSVVQIGDPTAPHTYGVFERETGSMQWRLVLGDYQYLQVNGSDGATLLQVAGAEVETPAWWSEPWNDDMAEAIARFKARAYRIGKKIKAAHNWCGTYENVMRAADITDAVQSLDRYRGVGVGDRVPANEVAGLPEGTLLRWRSTTHGVWEKFSLFVRDDNQLNMARTRNVLHYPTEQRGNIVPVTRNYVGTMEVLGFPDEDGMLHADIGMREHVVLLWPLLPTGTVLDFTGTYYQIMPDRRAMPVDRRQFLTDPLHYQNEGETGIHIREDFGLNPQLHVARIGGPR